jgi:hypothetical protein
MYVGLENADQMLAIDTSTNKIVAAVPIRQAPQAVVYVPGAVPVGTDTGLQAGEGMPAHLGGPTRGSGADALSPVGVAGNAAHFTLIGSDGADARRPLTTVALFDQGLLQVLEAAVTGLQPGQPYVLALAEREDGGGPLEPLSGFMANSAGAAIVNAVGPIRQIVADAAPAQRRYLVIAPGIPGVIGAAVQVMQSR